jgi:hypothetical protein
MSRFIVADRKTCQLRAPAADGGGLCSAPATAPVGVARHRILSLFKIAVRVKQYKDRVLLHLPSACPLKALLAKVSGRLGPSKRVAYMLATP